MALFNFGNKEVMFIPGCFSMAFNRQSIENYKKILKKFNIKFDTIDENFCCGGFLEEAGYEKHLRKKIRENFAFLIEKKVKKIVTSCSQCYYILSEVYKKNMPDWNIEIVSVAEEILKKIKERQQKNKLMHFRDLSRGFVFYYPSCYASRYLKNKNLADNEKKVLEELGYTILDIGEKAEICCGSCGGLMHTNKQFADSIAKNYLEWLEKKRVEKLITSDSRAFFLLGNNTKDKNIKILDFSEIILETIS